MSHRLVSDETTVLNAKATTGVGTSVNVADYRHILVSFATASSANLTVKFKGSISDTAPDFSAAQSVSNMWDTIQVKNLNTGTSTDGDTGIKPIGTDFFEHFEFNTNGLKWVTADVTARSAGSVTVKLVKFGN